ncbi:MAG: hypothetical protein DELT_01094 [Desulfovibrio sp.]
MKAIALIPFRNEEFFLPACLESLRGVADEVLGFDDGSIDSSKAIFESYGGLVKSSLSGRSGWSQGKEAEIRNSLLTWGRERGGTHFIWLDADEAFTANFREKARALMHSLQPGHKLLLQWLALWKKPSVYRTDGHWKDVFKDFIVCDTPDATMHEGFVHFGRTHGLNTPEMLHNVPLEEGAVLHFQYAEWERFQLKQCWYRCVELRRMPRTEEELNTKYAFTLGDSAALCTAVPANWTDGLPLPSDTVNEWPLSWHLAEVEAMFREEGAEYFEGLDIWHVPEIHSLFVAMTGREPDQQAKIKKSKLQRTVREACKKLLPEFCVNVLRGLKKRGR